MLQNLEDYLDKEHKEQEFLVQLILIILVQDLHFLVLINKLVELDFLESNKIKITLSLKTRVQLNVLLLLFSF
jgi:hypothetical protein